MRHEWSLPDEEQFKSLSKEKPLGWILDLGVDEGARVLLLFWRTWYIRNNVTHPTDKLSVEGSARFLAKYWVLEIFQLRYIVIFTIKEAFKPSKRD